MYSLRPPPLQFYFSKTAIHSYAKRNVSTLSHPTLAHTIFLLLDVHNCHKVDINAKKC